MPPNCLHNLQNMSPENEKKTLGANDPSAPDTSARPRARNFTRTWIVGGLGLGVGGLIVSWILGTCFFPDAYYIEWLVVATMGLYFLIAWLIHLRDDGIMKTRRRKPGSSDTGKALVAGASFLALASLVLYFFFGVGRALGG